jgi:hypothetical protein
MAALGEFVQGHAHLVERLAEVLVAGHGPAHLEHVVLGLEADAGFFLVGAGGAVGERLGARVFPQWLQRFLDLVETDVRTQGHVAMHMNFEWSVVARH